MPLPIPAGWVQQQHAMNWICVIFEKLNLTKIQVCRRKVQKLCQSCLAFLAFVENHQAVIFTIS
jgi:hypothetical protein